MLRNILSLSLLLALDLFATPDAPSDLVLEATSSTTVSINWRDNSDNETGFKIFRDGELIANVPTNTTSYVDRGLTPNTTYTYTIKATDDGAPMIDRTIYIDRDYQIPEDAVFIDIRNPWEREVYGGYPEGSQIAVYQFRERHEIDESEDRSKRELNPNFVDDVLRLTGNDKNRHVILICATGDRTGNYTNPPSARKILKDAGFTYVEDIHGGSFADGGWRDNNLPWIGPQTCQSSNPEVFIIKSISDWSHINDSDKRIFCVNPGDYGNDNAGSEEEKVFKITSSGTKNKRRYLLLNNGNFDHPARLVNNYQDKSSWINQLARYRIKLINANYWSIDRLAYWNDAENTHYSIDLINSTHNLFDRVLIADTTDAIKIQNHSDANNFKRMHIEKSQWSVDYNTNNPGNIITDDAAIAIIGNAHTKTVDNLFEDNEIINYVDPIQLVRNSYSKDNGEYEFYRDIDFAGTKIINNRFYVTSLLYTDCNGKLDPNGECSMSENGIDIKAGSHDINNPIIIKNNYLFGFKKSDYNGGDDEGTAIVSHYHVANLIITDNMIFNSDNGFGSDLNRDFANKWHVTALENATIKDNIFYNIKNNRDEIRFFSIAGTLEGILNGAKNITISDNIFANREKTTSIKLENCDDLTIKNNTFVKLNGSWIPYKYEGYENVDNRGVSFIDNTFYVNQGEDLGDMFNQNLNHSGNKLTEEEYDFSNNLHKKYITNKFKANPAAHYLVR